MPDWADQILDVGNERGFLECLEIVQLNRYRPGNSDDEELRFGYEKLNEATGWEPQVKWAEGVRRTVDWYANNRQA